MAVVFYKISLLSEDEKLNCMDSREQDGEGVHANVRDRHSGVKFLTFRLVPIDSLQKHLANFTRLVLRIIFSPHHRI